MFRTVTAFMESQKKLEGVSAFRVEISDDSSRLLSGHVRVLVPEATDWVVIGLSQDPELAGAEMEKS